MRQFGRGEIEEMTWGGSGDLELVEKHFSRTSRWEIWWWYIFRADGELWRVEFNEPATEMQEADWPEVFEPERVEPVEVIRIEYQGVERELTE
jgi:hypothetical protein